MTSQAVKTRRHTGWNSSG